MIHLRIENETYPLCGSILNRGDALTSELETNKCKFCLNIYQDKPKYRKIPFFERWAHFGEGHYGPLEWVAFGISTLGLGLLPIYLLKHLSKTIIYLKNR